ncbi:MAG TPA: hypothetical protein DEQ40_04840 [Oxalobacteraceae bacterium]|nr:hypothetical protein [Oxalobacteraceae bacterium]
MAVIVAHYEQEDSSSSVRPSWVAATGGGRNRRIDRSGRGHAPENSPPGKGGRAADSDIVAFDFDERDAGVKEMIRLTVEGGLRNGRHVGICGKAPSDYPEARAGAHRRAPRRLDHAQDPADLGNERAILQYFTFDPCRRILKCRTDIMQSFGNPPFLGFR